MLFARSTVARKIPISRTGLKLHFGNSDVNLDIDEHVERTRAVFAAANAHGMAIVVHAHANLVHKRPYGAKEARVFLERLLPSAPDVTVQIAHLAGGGDYDAVIAEALGMYGGRLNAETPAFGISTLMQPSFRPRVRSNKAPRL